MSALSLSSGETERFWVDDALPTGKPLRGGYLTEAMAGEDWPFQALAALHWHVTTFNPETQVVFLLRDPETGQGQFFTKDLSPSPNQAQWPETRSP